MAESQGDFTASSSEDAAAAAKLLLQVDIESFLERGRIARNAERCVSYSRSVRLSVCPLRSGVLSRGMKL